MSMHRRYKFALITLLALGANACSVRATWAARPLPAPLMCVGGAIHSASEAASYNGCTMVEGDLAVEGTQLSDLRALKSLRSISGALIIANNPNLISLGGLNGLRRASSVQIRNNRLLCARLGFLPRLGDVARPLVLRANPGVSRIEVQALLLRVKTAVQSPAVASRELALH